MRSAPRWLFFRAGVVGWRGRAILITGPPRSGTSTLVAELLRAGALYYSDQYAVLDTDGRVCPYPRPLWLSPPGGVHAVRCRAEELHAGVGLSSLPVGVVIFTQFRPGTRARLAPMTASAGTVDLAANAVCADTYQEQARARIREALSAAWILKGTRGESREVAALLIGGPGSQARSQPR